VVFIVPGGLLLVISSGYFAIAGVHIYWPRGVLTMLVMALAFGWVRLDSAPIRIGSTADRRRESRQSGPRRMTGPVVACTVWQPSTGMPRFDDQVFGNPWSSRSGGHSESDGYFAIAGETLSYIRQPILSCTDRRHQ
jgi:hypothetical protein